MIKLLILAVVPFMTQHRNVVPKTEVTTNFYGSVTGIVDEAYIQSRIGTGAITDVRTNGVSVVSGGIANIIETDPTVPAWAKADAPPQTMTTNSVREIVQPMIDEAVEDRVRFENLATEWIAGESYTNGQPVYVKVRLTAQKNIFICVKSHDGDDEVNFDDTEYWCPIQDYRFASQDDIPQLPEKWALANVTNAQGRAVRAADIGALGNCGDQLLRAGTGTEGLAVLPATGNDFRASYGPVTMTFTYHPYEDDEKYVQYYGFDGGNVPAVELYDGENDVFLEYPMKDGTLATTGDIPSVGGKVDKVQQPFTSDNFAALTADGGIKDSGKKASDFLPASYNDGGSYTVSANTTFYSLYGDALLIDQSQHYFWGARFFYNPNGFDSIEVPSRELAVKGDLPPISVTEDAEASTRSYKFYAGDNPSAANGYASFNMYPFTSAFQLVHGSTSLTFYPYEGIYGTTGGDNFSLQWPWGKSGTIAVESWQSLSRSLQDANTNRTADRECIGTNICKLIQQPVSNLVVECRDIYHDDELDVTFKKVVSGGRVYMKVIAVDGENAQ